MSSARSALGARRRPSVTTVVMLMAAGYFLLPLWWLTIAASKSQGDLVDNPGLWFSDFALVDNLAALFERGGGIFGRWLVNSGVYAGIGAAVGTLVAGLAGYVFAKFRFSGKEALFGLVLLGVLVPGTVLALPLFLMLSNLQLTNTMAAVLLPSMVSPLGVYLARVYADAMVPDEIIEAARVDGASDLRIAFTHGLPLMRTGLVTIFLLQFIAIWNNFLLPLVMLNDQNLYPTTLGLFNWTGQFIQDATLITSVITGSFVSSLPLLLGFIYLQRFLRGGLMAGGIRG